MDRYNRNILIDGFGIEGQAKLKESKVLVIGAGGLGSPVLFYLAAAGVGTLGVVDYDVVDVTNLQRQIIHQTEDIGRPKVTSATEKLKALNPEVKIEVYQQKFTEENAGDIIGEYDFVIDCCDNYEAKFLINDVCVKYQKPYSHAAVLSMQGEIMTYTPGNACYRCVFGAPPADGTVPVSAQVGILGAVAGVIGSMQAIETIKYLTRMGELITNRILIYDARKMSFHSLKVEKNKECTCCGE